MKNLITFTEFINESSINEAKEYKLKYDYLYHNCELSLKLRITKEPVKSEWEKIMSREWGDKFEEFHTFCITKKAHNKMDADFDRMESIFEPGKLLNLSNGMQIIFHKDPSIYLAKIPNYTAYGFTQEMYLYLYQI